ncbi:MAG TPA: hypothetical protein DIT13_06645 [Verrucomicrobiales bacterium]|nr:hypothetical protein [Verrucomicrobiales bacterium]HRJ10828.1 phosphodiester glycosidase family protein [Prosthecobacter sp.]HRK17233.1 phosphodiester glycosidase family protein [Prosthecobacter sp.]
MRHLLFLITAIAAAHGIEPVKYEGALYHVRRIPPGGHSRLELRWLDAAGQPLVHFGGLKKQLATEGKKIAFATNAGLYEKGPRPCGLTIIEGRELVPLQLGEGFGNFYLKPNGVFFLDDKTGPGIMETTGYAALSLRPRLAQQSGPLLLRKGAIHPAFRADSPNKRQRSAVGIVAATKEVVFVMSDREDRVQGRVTFHQLSRFFLHIGCQDALYLDGDISEMMDTTTRLPADAAERPTNTFAGMFVLVE